MKLLYGDSSTSVPHGVVPKIWGLRSREIGEGAISYFIGLGPRPLLVPLGVWSETEVTSRWGGWLKLPIQRQMLALSPWVHQLRTTLLTGDCQTV